MDEDPDADYDGTCRFNVLAWLMQGWLFGRPADRKQDFTKQKKNEI